jgi:hypothetical protein
VGCLLRAAFYSFMGAIGPSLLLVNCVFPIAPSNSDLPLHSTFPPQSPSVVTDPADAGRLRGV